MKDFMLIPETHTRVFVGERDYFVSDFDSLEEFYDFVDRYEKKYCIGKSSHNHKIEFNGTRNFEEARKLARVTGDLDSLKMLNFDDELELRKFAKGLSLEGLDVSLQTSGSYVDIDAYIQGQPECMAEFTESYIPKFCDIMINIAQSCGISKNTIKQRGITLFRLIDALERARIRTRIQLVWPLSVTYKDDDCNMSILRVVCKDYGQVLNKEQLSFAICHASFMRRFCFCHSEITSGFCSEGDNKTKKHLLECILGVNEGYGCPNLIKHIPDKIWKPKNNSHIFLLDDVNVSDLEQLEQEVLKLIRKENKKW